jgi:4-hydroxybenzoate polyprenyltransferase
MALMKVVMQESTPTGIRAPRRERQQRRQNSEEGQLNAVLLASSNPCAAGRPCVRSDVAALHAVTGNNVAVPHTPWPRNAALYLDLIRWDRPAGWLLLLWPTLSALWIAADGFPGWHLLVVFVLGTVLMRSAGCCVNDVADRDFDRHVKRTAQRPVTRGAITSKQALTFGALLTFSAFVLVLTTNPPTVLLSAVAFGVAVAYPYAKRWVSMPQAVLGVAFSFGIPMAFAAVLGGSGWTLAQVPWPASALTASNLFWVLAYDTEYAMVDRDDDVKIGMNTSAITLGRFDVAGVMLFYALFIAVWAAVGVQLAFGPLYFASLAAAAGIAGWHYTLIRGRTRDGCFRAFRLNHWLGFAVLAGVVLDHAAGRAWG